MTIIRCLSLALVFSSLISCGSKSKVQEGTEASSVTGGKCSEQIVLDMEEILERCDDDIFPGMNKLSYRDQLLKCEELIADFKTSYPQINCKTRLAYQGEELEAETSIARIQKAHELIKEELYRSNKGACGIEVVYRLKNEIMIAPVLNDSKALVEEKITNHNEFLEDYPNLDCTINFSDFPEVSASYTSWREYSFERSSGLEARVQKSDIEASLKELEASLK